MPRATCRCGEILTCHPDGPERIVCPKCWARIRVRRSRGANAAHAGHGHGHGDDFVRFGCPCGRRLKVRVEPDKPIPESGKCPDCGRVVPVPASAGRPRSMARRPRRARTYPTGHPEAITEELSATDLAMLDQWKGRLASAATSVRPVNAPGSGAGPGLGPVPGHASNPGPEPEPEPRSRSSSSPRLPIPTPVPAPPPAPTVEAGLRVCPRCGKPVHLSSIVCRECGAHVPKR